MRIIKDSLALNFFLSKSKKKKIIDFRGFVFSPFLPFSFHFFNEKTPFSSILFFSLLFSSPKQGVNDKLRLFQEESANRIGKPSNKGGKKQRSTREESSVDMQFLI